jgi:hypothetical protein
LKIVITKVEYHYDLKITGPIHQEFSRVVLNKPAEKIAEGWTRAKINNTAKNPPQVVKTAGLILIRVGKNVNALGYVPKSAVTGDVKIVLEIK